MREGIKRGVKKKKKERVLLLQKKVEGQFDSVTVWIKLAAALL